MHSLLIIIWTYPSSPFHRLKYHNWKFPLTKPKVRFNFQSNSSIDQHTTEKNWVSLTLGWLVLCSFWLFLVTHFLFVCFCFFSVTGWQDGIYFQNTNENSKLKRAIFFLFLIQNEIRMPNNESSRVIKRKIVVIVPVQCWHFKVSKQIHAHCNARP